MYQAKHPLLIYLEDSLIGRNNMLLSLKRAKPIFLLVVVLLLVSVLAACGETNPALTDKNYAVPVYEGTKKLDLLSQNPNFTATVLNPSSANFVEPVINVYSTSSALSDTKNWYQNEFTSKGWIRRTGEVLKADALSSNGWVESFSKDQRVVSIIMVGVSGRDTGLLKDYREFLIGEDGKNILVVMEATYKQGAGAASATPTPAK
jgi:hypothetical protein